MTGRSLWLPWTSHRLGRTVMAVVRTVLDEVVPASIGPSDALIVSTRWPSVRFMLSMPPEIPGHARYLALDALERHEREIAWEEWIDRFLVETIAAPSLRLGDTARFGRDRMRLVHELLTLWGWLPGEGDLPAAVAETAVMLHRLPSELMELPFPVFAVDYRMLTVYATDRSDTLRG